MSYDLVNPKDPLEHQNARLLTIVSALIRRVEQGTQTSGLAYAQFQRSVILEEEVHSRTQDLDRTLDLLNDSNAQLARANAETEAARSNLANAIETVQEGFALFDPDDFLVMCNRRFGRHLKDIYHFFKPGLAYTEYVSLVSGSPFLKLPEGRTPQDWAANRLSRHKDDHVVFNARMADQRWFQISEHRTENGGTVVFQTDVTDMVRLERKERDRLLDDQARLIRATLEHLNQGICIFDSENRLVGWNRQVGELMSIPVGRLNIGISFVSLFEKLRQEFTFIKKTDIRKIEQWIKQRKRSLPLSFQVRTKNHLDLTAFAQHIPDNGFVISFTDVTAERAAVRAIYEANETLERRVAERTLELEGALSEAERANTLNTRFVAAASHDLLQPLSAAKLYIASLETEPLSEDLRDRLSKANNALLSVESILGALLDISKLDSGSAALNISDVPLGILLTQLQDEFDPVAREKGLNLVFVPTRVFVRSDATFLRRIVQNLISNAVRYTSTGTVLVGVRHYRDTISLEVWDTGPGIPESQQERIFDEFQRLNAAASSAEGMGLGLAIVDRACRLLGHPLSVNSTLHKGTRFCVGLPRSPKQALMAQRAIPQTLKSSNSIEGSVILIIENEPELRNALTITLESWGGGVFSSANENDAVKLLEEVDIVPDAIIADFQLDDGLFGTDAIAHLRARFGPIPACLISANPASGLLEVCEKSGIPLFQKPIDLQKLRKFLSHATQF